MPNPIYVPEFEASASVDTWERRLQQLDDRLKLNQDETRRLLSERKELLTKRLAIQNAMVDAV
jgi:hypothetical protein